MYITNTVVKKYTKLSQFVTNTFVRKHNKMSKLVSGGFKVALARHLFSAFFKKVLCIKKDLRRSGATKYGALYYAFAKTRRVVYDRRSSTVRGGFVFNIKNYARSA